MLLAVAGLVTMIIGGALYMQQIDFEGVRLSALNAQDTVKQMETSVRNSEGTVEAMKTREAMVNAGIELAAAADEAKTRVAELKKERLTVAQDFGELVKTVRASAMDVVVPELKLKSGARLANAKIKKFDDGGVIFLHSEGVIRVSDDLPDAIKNRFRLDVEAKVAAIESQSKAAQAKEEEVEKKPAVAGPVLAAAPPPSQAAVTVDAPPSNLPSGLTAAEDLALRTRLGLVRLQIQQLESQKQPYLDKVRTLNSRATLRSATTTTYYDPYYGTSYYSTSGRIHSDPAQAAVAQQKIDEIDKQIFPLKAEIVRLEARLGIPSNGFVR